MSRQTTILVIVFIVLSFAAGLGAGLKVGGISYGQLIKPGENTYQAGWEAAKKRLSDSGFYPAMPGGMEIKNLSGEIKEVNGDKITLKTRAMEPLADPELDTRTIIVDSNTKIYQMEQRDSQVVQKEMEEFQKMMQERMKDPATAKPGTPPEAFTKKEIKISDLKSGQQISVTSNANIKDAKEIKAVEIISQFMAIAPAVTGGVNLPGASLPPMSPAPTGPIN